MHIKKLESPKNPLIKELALLRAKSKVRRERGLFIVEGLRELSRAIASGYVMESVLYRPELIDEGEVSALLSRAIESRGAESSVMIGYQHLHCSAKAFAKVAYRVDVPNLVGVMRAQRYATLSVLEERSANQSPLLLILEGIEKPGNLGAILRSADAFGVDGVILVDSPAEVEHPNCLRNSLGAALSLEVITLGLEATCDLLQRADIPLYVTHLNERSIEPRALPLNEPCAIVLGAESTGASRRWFERGAQATLIPMPGARVVDSLNVSVAAAVMLYEVSRQRRT